MKPLQNIAAAIRRQPEAVALVLVLLLGLLASEDAWGRAGGGHGYSGGGRSSGGGSSGGGGGDGGGAILWLLIRLVIEFPAIGIPLCIVVGLIWWKAKKGQSGRTWRPGPSLAPAASSSRTEELRALVSADPNFSMPLFLDFVQLVYAHGQELRLKPRGAEVLSPWFTTAALDSLGAATTELREVKDVIFGAVALRKIEIGQSQQRLTVDFETNYTEVGDKSATTFHSTERWVFSRKAGIHSPGPDRMEVLSCAACGSSAEPKSNGTCPNCGEPRMGGDSQWCVTSLQQLSRRVVKPVELELGGGGVEAGTELPTRFDPDLAASRRAMLSRHPEHDWNAFLTEARSVFKRIQEAWSSGKWELARPLETDALFRVHRLWIERYQREKLQNRLEDVSIQKVDVVRVGMDAFYETVTLRIFASMRDSTIDTRMGKVVGGNPAALRSFSEYWTFLRAVGGKPRQGGWDSRSCPSCGAPADKVNMAGVCGYCDAKITTGAFDWVLSRIEQDESYVG